ncbi:histone-fold-containing protein [Acephala macrosclerotiorum]|nr:histone-fold-containing protein [Acephala macrosclerotiorum]
MPPKKVPPPPSATGDEGTPKQDTVFREGINIEDLNLPKSIVTRLAKGVLPPNTQIQGNAMLAMTKSATVFVNYLASQANEFAASANRKTISPQDVFAALDEAQLSDFKPRLEAELAKFNEVQADKRNAYKSKVASSKAAGHTHGEEDGDGDSLMDRDGQPASKKARRDPDDSVMDASEMTEGYSRADHTADEEGDDGGDETEADEDEDEGEERLEVEERLEEPEEKEEHDEALDNGEDSE